MCLRKILLAAVVSLSIYGNQFAEAEVRLGSRGSEVSELQYLLTWWGYLQDPIDGVAGQSTINALLNFQYDAGLYGDGVAGAETFAILRQEKPIPSDQPNFAPIGSEIKPGMHGAGVVDLQKNLIAWGYYHGAEDGYMGDSTVSALRDFQNDAGLEPDGICGDATWRALGGDLPSRREPTPEPVQIQEPIQNPEPIKDPEPIYQPIQNPEPIQQPESKHEFKKIDKPEVKLPNQNVQVGEEVSAGMKGAGVVSLQESLIKLNYLDGDASGVADSKTIDALKKFQKDSGLTADGIAGKSTYKMLEEKQKSKKKSKDKKSKDKIEQPVENPSDKKVEVIEDIPDDFFDVQDPNVWSEEIPANGRAVYVEATAYSAFEPEGSPYTTRGHRVKRGVVAVDPSFIPLGSKMFIPGYGRAIADDIGIDIIGNRIDIAFDTAEEAMIFGKQQMEIYLIDE